MLHKIKLSDTMLLFISSLIVNAGNYSFNLLIGRLLTPAEFSEANLLVSLLLGFSFIAIAFQLTAAKYQISVVQSFTWGGVLCIILILSALLFKDFFHLESITPILLLAVGIPLYFTFSIYRGRWQGALSFKKLAMTYQIEMWTRFFIGLGFVLLGMRINGLALALLISLLSTYILCIYYRKPNLIENNVPTREVQSFFIITLLYELSQVLINNSDVWLVKHYFEASEAGQYAALNLVGRVVYFGTWSVVMVFFPKVIEAAKNNQPTYALFRKALSLVCLIAFGIVAVCYLIPQTIIIILLGKAYLSVAHLLWQYAFLTALFAIANVFIYYYLSLNRFRPIYFSIIAGILQIGSIVWFHQDFDQIIVSQLICIAFLLTSLICYGFLSKRSKCAKYQSAISLIGKVVAAK